MRQILFILLCLQTLAGCAQNKEQQATHTTMAQTAPAAPADFKTLKKYDQEPIYQVTVNTESFAYQIRINDLPVYNHSGKYGGAITFFVNQAILQSGNQTLTVYLMPRPGGQQLADSKDFTIQLSKSSWQKGGGMTEPVPVLNYALPELNNNKQAQFKDPRVFGHTLNFEAVVPYKFAGWTNSLPIGKNDEKLRQEAVSVYNRMIADYDKKDGHAFMGALGQAELMAYQANYLTPADAQQKHDAWVAFVNKGDKPIVPLENYVTEIVGNGKLVRLKRTDDVNNGEGVLRIPYRQNNRDRTVIYDVYFHRPAGSGRLEPIWFNMMDKN